VDCGSEPGRSPCGREGNRAGPSSQFHDTLGDPLAFTRLLRTATAGLILGLGLVLMPTTVTPARADPIGNCTTTSGTIVAVDFSHWGGPLVRGCGVNSPSGYALLHAAGFTTAGDAHDGPALTCRIGNEVFQHGTQYPTPAQDPCILTPPTTAYWSYWLAPAGQNHWTYSERGAISDEPKPGEVELWTFGGTNTGGTTGSGVPSFSPDTVRAHNGTPAGESSAPTPTTRRPAPVTNPTAKPGTHPVGLASGPPSTAATGNAPSSRTTAPTGGIAGTPTTTGTRSGTSRSTTASSGGGSSDPSVVPRIVAALPALSEHESSGSIAPVLIGIGLIAVLGAGTAGSMLRRRHRRE
jgi:hypothetical protein